MPMRSRAGARLAVEEKHRHIDVAVIGADEVVRAAAQRQVLLANSLHGIPPRVSSRRLGACSRSGSPLSRTRRVRIPLVIPMDDVARHYSRGDLLSRLNAALAADGADPAQPTADALAPYDHFHGRGLEATIELADLMPARAGDHVLDIGSGIGGPARHIPTRLNCPVTRIDPTPEGCGVPRPLPPPPRPRDPRPVEAGGAPPL